MPANRDPSGCSPVILHAYGSAGTVGESCETGNEPLVGTSGTSLERVSGDVVENGEENVREGSRTTEREFEGKIAGIVVENGKENGRENVGEVLGITKREIEGKVMENGKENVRAVLGRTEREFEEKVAGIVVENGKENGRENVGEVLGITKREIEGKFMENGTETVRECSGRIQREIEGKITKIVMENGDENGTEGSGRIRREIEGKIAEIIMENGKENVREGSGRIQREFEGKIAETVMENGEKCGEKRTANPSRGTGSGEAFNGLEDAQGHAASYRSLPSRELHEKLIRDFFELVLDKAVFEGTSRSSKVVEWTDPSVLGQLLDLTLPEEGVSHATLLALADSIIRLSVKTGHPRFANQLFSGVDPYGLLGQWLTDALNPSVYTYEVSPVFSLMEERVLREMRLHVGWPEGHGDGLFCPGGSIANGYAVSLARHRKSPEAKQAGLFGAQRMLVFASEDAHYSLAKLSAFMGLGTDGVRSVKVDQFGRMCPRDLEARVEEAIGEGCSPIMVAATAGTTVLGAFDPLRRISAVCAKYGLWFHVDAAWGGGALLSDRYKGLLDGIESADSVTWNPHKLLAAPQQCSTLLTRHRGLLESAHASGASYLFQRDKFYDTTHDSGDKHVQCGRRADVLKFWLMWKAKGRSGLARHVDRVFQLAGYFADFIRDREGWQLLLEPECTNVCFRFVPVSLRGFKGEQLAQGLQRIAPLVKERMVRKGTMMITYQPLRGQPNFFRLVLQNSGVTEDDLRFFAEEIERLAGDL